MIVILIFVQISLFSCSNNSSIQLTKNKDSSHPKLILTQNGVLNIRKNLGSVPLFDVTLAKVKEEIDAEILVGIDVPIPKDFSGGYTHTRHKKNYIMMQKAGVLYQILDEEKYALYVKEMLFAYEKLYPTLPLHPQIRSYARGKLFWQCLNDSNWLVYTSQAYDCIYDYLSENERKQLETNLFRPFADFISKGNPQFFNRVHNHSTWGNVAVGMIALVMDDESLLQTALYGLKTDKLQEGMKDNDGGFIRVKGQKVGFFANLDEPFSPDGYYTEGPYYQRYAMYPFLIFAEALHNTKPEMKIFEYKDSVLIKAVNSLLNLSDIKGNFFPLNDAQKGMSYQSKSLVSAVSIAYKYGGRNPQLLSVAENQGRVSLDEAGFVISEALKEGKKIPFNKESINLSDGPKGNQGGVAVLRKDKLELVFKYAAHGLSHGHYDKLSFSLYHKGDEVIQDYGLVRYVNIEQKGGGNYLKENKSWAKQTIAHNTITQNEQSHFKGKFEIASSHHSELYFYNDSLPNLKIVSAKEKNAYPGTEIQRTMALIKDTDIEYPYVLDIVDLNSNATNTYDLPFYYLGQLMGTNFNYQKLIELKPVGKKNGYQHLWKVAEGKPQNDVSKVSWLNKNRFYSLTSVANKFDQLLFTRIGANDPNFNLRSEPSFMIRRNAKNTTFVSVIEPHGSYSPVSEMAINATSAIEHIEIKLNTNNYLVVGIENKSDKNKLLIITKNEATKTKKHILKIKDKVYKWSGPFFFIND